MPTRSPARCRASGARSTAGSPRAAAPRRSACASVRRRPPTPPPGARRVRRRRDGRRSCPRSSAARPGTSAATRRRATRPARACTAASSGCRGRARPRPSTTPALRPSACGAPPARRSVGADEAGDAGPRGDLGAGAPDDAVGLGRHRPGPMIMLPPWVKTSCSPATAHRHRHPEPPGPPQLPQRRHADRARRRLRGAARRRRHPRGDRHRRAAGLLGRRRREAPEHDVPRGAPPHIPRAAERSSGASSSASRPCWRTSSSPPSR